MSALSTAQLWLNDRLGKEVSVAVLAPFQGSPAFVLLGATGTLGQITVELDEWVRKLRGTSEWVAGVNTIGDTTLNLAALEEQAVSVDVSGERLVIELPDGLALRVDDLG